MLSKYFRLSLVLIIAGSVGILAGCRTNKNLVTSFAPENSEIPTPGPSYIYPSEPNLTPTPTRIDIASLSPDAMIDYETIQYTPITLAECITRALSDSEVFRDLGGTIVAQAAAIDTSLDPALRYTSPTSGEDAALSAFDANVVTGLFFENNDRPFNNRFSGNTNGLLTQDLGEFNVEISKLAATGTLLTSRSRVNFDANNQAGNRFGSSWEAIIDSGFRHPLLQGSGSLFNRIAGPSQTPGSYNGVLIARTNTEIGLAEFEESSREFVSNVENAYWDLYYAYRELNAQTEARDAALEVLKKTRAQAQNERIPRLEQASADEQYLRFESAIVESLEGRLIEGTQVDSGSSGGSFRRTVGVRVAERRLRYVIGMPITDGTLLQPVDEPVRVATVFDWECSVETALGQRPELRRQRWLVKQKELELTAARNFLLPRLDLVGNYRFRGLGKDLTGGGTTLQDDIDNGTDMSSAFSDLWSGNFQEVQIGAELRMPVGYRQAHAAVRNAELYVQRENAILSEQERHIVLNLSNAVAEARRAFSAMMIAEKRFKAAKEYRDQAATRVDSGRSQMDVLLEAQRRMLESQIQFINAEVDYAIAIKNVHYEKGTFLQFHGVALSESESNPRAYVDNERRVASRKTLINYIVRDTTIARSPLADAALSDYSTVEYGDVPLDELPTEASPALDGETPMGTGVDQPGTEFEAPVPPSNEFQVPLDSDADSPGSFIPLNSEPPLSTDSTSVIETAQNAVEWTPPPSDDLVQSPQAKLATAIEQSPATPVTLTDLPKNGQPVVETFQSAPEKSGRPQSVDEVKNRGPESDETTKPLANAPTTKIAMPALAPPSNFANAKSIPAPDKPVSIATPAARNPGAIPAPATNSELGFDRPSQRVYLADLPPTGKSVPPGTHVSDINPPVTMNLSGSSRNDFSADANRAQASFSDRSGLGMLKPMMPAPNKVAGQQEHSSRKPVNLRLSDAANESTAPQPTTQQYR